MRDNETLLKHHCLLSSTDSQEIRNRISELLWPHEMTLSPNRQLKSEVFGVSFGNVGLFSLGYGADVEINAGDIRDYYLIRATLSGHGEVELPGQRATMNPGRLTITSPTMPCIIRRHHDYRSMILRVKRSAIEHHLQKSLDRIIGRPLVFDLDVPPTDRGVSQVFHAMNYISQMHEDDLAQALPPALSKHLSDYLVALLVDQLPHNYCEEMEQCACPIPFHVKRARDYIDTNLSHNISMQELANVAGVSVRALQYGFKHFLKMSPSEYARSSRLNRVHEQLMASPPGQRVTDILLDNGVLSFGHFSGAYKKRFGCLPSETLRSG